MKIVNKMILMKNLLLLLLPLFSFKAVMSLEHTNLTYFSSSLSAAHGMEKIYDDHKESGTLWSKQSLIPCNFSKSPECLVCTEPSVKPETVYVICSNLPTDVDLKFEGPDGHIRFNKIERLPQMKSPGALCFNKSWLCSTSSPPVSTPPVLTETNSNKHWGLGIALIIFIIIIIIIFIIIMVVLVCRRQRQIRNVV